MIGAAEPSVVLHAVDEERVRRHRRKSSELYIGFPSLSYSGAEGTAINSRVTQKHSRSRRLPTLLSLPSRPRRLKGVQGHPTCDSFNECDRHNNDFHLFNNNARGAPAAREILGHATLSRVCPPGATYDVTRWTLPWL